MTKRCLNCAWFCHADSRCYAHQLEWENHAAVHGYTLRFDSTFLVNDPDQVFCCNWSADGLEDWEREALMTVEAA